MKKILLFVVGVVVGIFLGSSFHPYLNQKNPPSAVADNGYILIKVSGPKEALAMMLKHRELSVGDAPGVILTPACFGNVMDNPQGFDPTLKLPLAFNWDGENLAFIVYDGQKFKRVDSVADTQPVYLLFSKKS